MLDDPQTMARLRDGPPRRSTAEIRAALRDEIEAARGKLARARSETAKRRHRRTIARLEAQIARSAAVDRRGAALTKIPRLEAELSEKRLSARLGASQAIGQSRAGYEVGPAERAAHGGWVEDLELSAVARPAHCRASTERGVVIGRRRRYGGDIERLRVDERLKRAARHYAMLAEASRRVAHMRGCLASLEPLGGGGGDGEGADVARRRFVSAEGAFRRARARLSPAGRMVAGAPLSPRAVVQAVVIDGAPLSLVHGGHARLDGNRYRAARNVLLAGLTTLAEHFGIRT